MSAVFNDQSFNDMLTKDIISFGQLGPDLYLIEAILRMRYTWFIQSFFKKALNFEDLT